MKDRHEELHLHKKWLIRTTDFLFHKNFKARCCPGNHAHARIEGQETSRTAYYPLHMVTSIMRHWMRVLVPLRHLRYLSACTDVHDNKFAYKDENWVRRAQPLQDPMKQLSCGDLQAFPVLPDSGVSQPLALLPDMLIEGNLLNEVNYKFHMMKM